MKMRTIVVVEMDVKEGEAHQIVIAEHLQRHADRLVADKKMKSTGVDGALKWHISVRDRPGQKPKRNWWPKRIAAWWRAYKCENGIHDYHDGTFPVPLHFYTYTCRHCARKFEI